MVLRSVRVVTQYSVTETDVGMRHGFPGVICHLTCIEPHSTKRVGPREKRKIAESLFISPILFITSRLEVPNYPVTEEGLNVACWGLEPPFLEEQLRIFRNDQGLAPAFGAFGLNVVAKR